MERNNNVPAVRRVNRTQASWIWDGLLALSMAGIVVFNAAGLNVILRIAVLIVGVIALWGSTRYSSTAYTKSDRYLMRALCATVCGFIVTIVIAVVVTFYFSALWVTMLLFGVMSVIIFLLLRGFRARTQTLS